MIDDAEFDRLDSQENDAHSCGRALSDDGCTKLTHFQDIERSVDGRRHV